MENYYWFVLFVLINSAILFALTANISRLGLKLKISLGDGSNKEMLRAIRAQANGIEQVPIFALVLLALTFTQASEVVLASFTILFSLARLAHAYGMLFKQFMGRRLGAVLSYLLQFVAILLLAYQVI